MSKLYEHYKYCKDTNPDKIILIKSGAFYIIIDEDARNINERLGLKLTMLINDIEKCGFPINSFSKYEKMLKANSIDYFVTDLASISNNNKEIERAIIKDIRNLEIDNISPVTAFNKLVKYREKLKIIDEI